MFHARPELVQSHMPRLSSIHLRRLPSDISLIHETHPLHPTPLHSIRAQPLLHLQIFFPLLPIRTGKILVMNVPELRADDDALRGLGDDRVQWPLYASRNDIDIVFVVD